MRNLSKNVLGLCLIGMGLGVGAPAQAATGVGPYYAMPAWDQTLPAATRFIVLSNMNSDAVLDRETGLVWEKSPVTETLAWDRANAECRAKIVGSRKGWRLPTVQELLTLIDTTVPGLPSGHPFLNVPATGWTATSTLNPPGTAAFFVFMSGVNAGIGLPALKTLTTVGYWCVRGGSGLDAQ